MKSDEFFNRDFFNACLKKFSCQKQSQILSNSQKRFCGTLRGHLSDIWSDR